MSLLRDVVFIGASRRTGKAKQSGNPYDICIVNYGVPIQSVQRENMAYDGHGLDIKEIGLDPAYLSAFASVEAGSKVNLALELDPANPQKNRCVGVE